MFDKDKKGGKTEVAERSNTMPSTEVLNFAADAGAGLEGADKDSFAIPFIAILQGLSPQMETVEGAKLGLFINTITNDLSNIVTVVPCAFQRRYLEWEPRSKGGGFRGMHEVSEVESSGKYKRDEDPKSKTLGQLVTPDGNVLKDTRIHYVLVVNADGSFAPAIISMSSTQIKKSKRWLSRIQGVQLKDSSGKAFNPPSFSHAYCLTTVKESNNEGEWYGYEIGAPVAVTDPILYAAAKALHAQAVAGAIQAAPPQPEAEGGEKF